MHFSDLGNIHKYWLCYTGALYVLQIKAGSFNK